MTRGQVTTPTDGRLAPRSQEWRAAISRGLRRAAWSHQQQRLARLGLVHDAVTGTKTIQLGKHMGNRVIRPGDCHWCVFLDVNPGHTGATFE